MGYLRDLLGLLQAEGGHILIALILLLVGLHYIAAYHSGEGRDLFVWALAVMGYAMKQGKSSS
jgi:hypothetical protein